MARLPRRFRLWPRDNILGIAADLAFMEGVLFVDGTIVLRVPGKVNGVFTFPDRTVEQILGMDLFSSPPRLEWLDGSHEG